MDGAWKMNERWTVHGRFLHDEISAFLRRPKCLRGDAGIWVGDRETVPCPAPGTVPSRRRAPGPAADAHTLVLAEDLQTAPDPAGRAAAPSGFHSATGVLGQDTREASCPDVHQVTGTQDSAQLWTPESPGNQFQPLSATVLEALGVGLPHAVPPWVLKGACNCPPVHPSPGLWTVLLEQGASRGHSYLCHRDLGRALQVAPAPSQALSPGRPAGTGTQQRNSCLYTWRSSKGPVCGSGPS